MATVTSMTATKIQSLLSEWESIGLSQDDINSRVIQLRDAVLGQIASVDEFSTIIRPQLEAALAGNSNALSNLNDNVLPGLTQDLDAASLAILNLMEVIVPSIQDDLINTIVNVSERPKVYVQDEAPTNPDIDDRSLVVGDTWYDSNDGNKQKIWDGVAWSTFTVDVPNLTQTILQYISPTHALFTSPVTGSTAVVNGANITPAP